MTKTKRAAQAAPTPAVPSPDQAMLQALRWRKVTAPKMWQPAEVGEELTGYYGGRSVRSGSYGEYTVILMHVPERGTLMLSGFEIVQLVDAAQITHGHPVRVRWNGFVELASGHKKKSYELFVADFDLNKLTPDVISRLPS